MSANSRSRWPSRIGSGGERAEASERLEPWRVAGFSPPEHNPAAAEAVADGSLPEVWISRDQCRRTPCVEVIGSLRGRRVYRVGSDNGSFVNCGIGLFQGPRNAETDEGGASVGEEIGATGRALATRTRDPG